MPCFRAKIGIKRKNDDSRKNKPYRNRSGNITGGDQKTLAIFKKHAVLLQAGSLVGLHAHDMQVDGIECKLGQDSRQDSRDAQPGVQEARTESRCHTGQNSNKQRQPCRAAADNQHNRYRTAGSKCAVNTQVGNVQHAEGNINSEGHKTPEDALGTSRGHPGEKVQEIQIHRNCLSSNLSKFGRGD